MEFISEIEKISPLSSDEETFETVLGLGDLRPDVVKPSLSIEEVLMNAPRTQGRLFVVPQVVE